MTQTPTKRPVRRGRLFPEFTLPPEQLAREKAEDEEFYRRCQVIFERVQSELMKAHYNWFIVIEPDSDSYFIEADQNTAMQKTAQNYPGKTVGVFRLNETGACGRI